MVAMATASSRMSKPNVPVLTDGVEQTVPPPVPAMSTVQCVGDRVCVG